MFKIPFLGPKCSTFCLILSVWGIIMLALLGIFFRSGAVALYEDVAISGKETSMNCFIVAGIYVVTLALSIHQRWVNKQRQKYQQM
ncbi:ribonuclease kappa-B-like [Corticium candelabrum]|uniref:ribonuclease kappa-B-like n=1 Tax=Corticium candelabrum TaxID=121492 RepID=UPI002E26F186|nr:ribonuclease kappa-B-like [Corticium candelabrum]